VKAIIEISDASGVVRTLETSLVASGSEASVSVPAEQPLAAGSYTWRARAQDSNGLQSDWSAARAFTVSAANQPPAVPTLVAPSDNATVSQTPTFRVGLSDPDGDQVKAIIEISDASGVVRTLETSLVASGSEASVSVPAEQPLAAGSYTWRARAQDSNGLQSDWSAARALIVAEGVPILLQGVRTFALIGAGVSSPDSLGLGGVELVRWDASAQRYSRVSQLQPGEGYFVKATTPVQTVLRGDPIIGEFTLQLRPGWNLIAIPTLTAVAWDLDGVQVQRGVERKSLREAQRAGWVEDYLWGWQQSADDPMSGQYQLVYDARILPPVPAPPDPTSHEHPVYGFASVLKPFQAYWIFARESCALVLNSERGRAAAVAPVSDSSAWVLQIEAVRGSGVSNSVWIGIAKGRSWHAALAPAPPQGEPPVQVRVRRQEGSFAADLRSAMDRDTRWHIEVVVAPSEQPQPITLRVNNLTRLPRGVNLALIDEQSGARRPLRMAASSLSFTAPAEGGVFRFAIEPISQRALLRVLNPTVRGGSRSGEAITLGFTLTTEAQTQVQIRAGSRTVRTLSDHRTRSAGLQEFVWDGRDDSGTHLPPGAYTAEITAISSDGQTARVAVPILIRR
jgi:methionine-rich copper-binding protein CopC